MDPLAARTSRLRRRAPRGKGHGNYEAAALAQFEGYAHQLGLDLERFRRDLASPEVQQRIDRDLADGQRAGVAGTPTLFVNGVRFSPTGDTAAEVERELRDLVEAELAG